jgi:ABC-type nitrate/sulfonate/bicarbonate transport system substrate-binding protein
MKSTLLHLAGLVTLFGPTCAVKIATSLQVIEHTPQPYAIKNFYKGQASIVSGGVASLLSDKTVDLGANAEYQGLIQYGTHKNIRMIYTIVDVPYRLVANKAAGISSLADLKGKRVGSIPGTSANYFVRKLLGSVGVKESEFTVVSGNGCMRAPCGSGTLPAQLQAETIDALGTWEPAPELGAQALGDQAIIFQNATVFREIYSLFTTTEKLEDPASRRAIVEFVRALDQAVAVFRNPPEKVYQFVADAVGMDATTVRAIWPVHKWAGTLGVDMDSDMIDYMVEEDVYVASQNRRQPMTREVIAQFVDTSVIAEARNSSYLRWRHA